MKNNNEKSFLSRSVELMGSMQQLSQGSPRWMQQVVPLKRSADATLSKIRRKSETLHNIQGPNRRHAALEIAALTAPHETSAPEMLRSSLFKGVRPGRPAVAAPAPPPIPEAVTQRGNLCAKCSQVVSPGVKYCTNCGAMVKT